MGLLQVQCGWGRRCWCTEYTRADATIHSKEDLPSDHLFSSDLHVPILNLYHIFFSDETPIVLRSSPLCFSQATKYHIHVSFKNIARPKNPEALQVHFICSLTDDQGYADVGFTNPSCPFVTPNIDSLAASAVRLTNYYVHPTCTPTRAALLTGRLQLARNYSNTQT